MGSIGNITLLEARELCKKHEHECIDCPLQMHREVKFRKMKPMNYIGCMTDGEPDDWEFEDGDQK